MEAHGSRTEVREHRNASGRDEVEGDEVEEDTAVGKNFRMAPRELRPSPTHELVLLPFTSASSAAGLVVSSSTSRRSAREKETVGVRSIIVPALEESTG